MATQIYLGQFPIDGNSDSFTISTGTPKAITLSSPGPYYIASHDTESTQLVDHITTKMQAETGFSAANCTFSYTTGKVTFDFAATTTITWDDTELRDILGFASGDTVSGASTYTGSRQAKYVWHPSRSLSSHPVQQSRVFAPESTSMVYRSRDGTITSVVGQLLYRGDLEYMYLADTEVITPAAGSINEDFEAFFEDIIHFGRPIRLFPDDTDDGDSSYTTLIVGVEEDEVGSFTEYASRNISNYNGLWRVRIPVMKVI